MNTKNKIKLIEGGLIGAALGVAAGIMLAPESGKKFRGDIKKKAAEFHAYLAPRLNKMKWVGEEGYQALLDNAMKTFSKAKGLSEKEAKSLISYAKKSWKHVVKHSKS